jgi:hypothetical protein
MPRRFYIHRIQYLVYGVVVGHIFYYPPAAGVRTLLSSSSLPLPNNLQVEHSFVFLFLFFLDGNGLARGARRYIALFSFRGGLFRKFYLLRPGRLRGGLMDVNIFLFPFQLFQLFQQLRLLYLVGALTPAILAIARRSARLLDLSKLISTVCISPFAYM